MRQLHIALRSVEQPERTDPIIESRRSRPGLGQLRKADWRIRHSRAREDDAVVKWDGDGRMRLHQPCLKKVYPATRLDRSAKIGAKFASFRDWL
jgi:hypothetical protein